MIRSKIRPTLAALALALLVTSTFALPAVAAPRETADSTVAGSVARVADWLQAAWSTLLGQVHQAIGTTEPPPPPDYSTADDDRGVVIDPDGAP